MSDLSLRERKFVQAKIAGKSTPEAAMEATGAKRSVAAVQGHRMLRSVNVQNEIQKALKKYKITTDKIVKVYVDGIEAKKLIVHGKDADTGWTEEVPDHKVRITAADRLAKLAGMETSTVTVTPLSQTIEPTPELEKALEGNNEVELQRIVFKKHE